MLSLLLQRLCYRRCQEKQILSQRHSQLPIYPTHCFFIRCNSCNSWFYSICIQQIYAYASAEGKRDPLLVELKNICDNGPHTHVPEVLGFCCRIRKEVQETRWSMPPHKESLHTRLKQLVSLGITVITGLLFLPTIRLFLDLPNNTVDIHGFGFMSDVANG